MQKKDIKVNTVDTLIWPQRCPHCGQDLKEGDTMGFELKIRRGMKGLFTAGFGPKSLVVKLCGPCAKKISNYRVIEGVGGLVMFVAILGPLLLKRFMKVQSAEYIYVIGTAFWIGVIFISTYIADL